MRRSIFAAAASALALAVSPAVFAQQASGQQPSQSQQASGATTANPQQTGSTQIKRPDVAAVVLIAPAAASVPAVTPEALYKGFRADALIGQDVYGTNGNQIGEVQDILVNKDGQIAAIVVEGGGFLDIADATFRVPWNQVDLTAGKEGVVARNLTEAKAEDLGLFDRPEVVLTGPREFRVGELTGDWALLRDGQGYGYVRDVVFSREGKALGVLVSRDARYGAGLFAYPYYGYGYGWDPALSYYALPFESLAVAANAPKLDAKRFEKGVL